LYLPFWNCVAAPAVDDHCPQFPNQAFQYTIDFGVLPNMGGVHIEMMVPNQNQEVIKYKSAMKISDLRLIM